MSHGTGNHVEELITLLSCPPCPSTSEDGDDVPEEFPDSFRCNIVTKLKELSELLTQDDTSLSVVSSRAVPTEECLVEDMDDLCIRSIGMDVLLHVIGLYSALGGGVFARDPVVATLLATMQSVLERNQGTPKLVDRAMPGILEEVHNVVVAHVDFEEKSCASVSLMRYNGPNTWERYLRSVELIWLLQHVSYKEMTVDECIIACRTVALGCKDVSYRVRNTCLEALCILIQQFQEHSMLEQHERVLSDILVRSIVANDDRCWDGTYRAVSCMVLALPSERHEKVLEQSIQQAHKNSHSLVFASSWLQQMNPCLEHAGISLMQYSTMLLPTLLEWVQALHEDVRCNALDALHTYVRVCWPRNHAHARTIWGVLQQVYSSSEMSSSKVYQVAEVIWVTSGQEFRSGQRRRIPRDELTMTITKNLD